MSKKKKINPYISKKENAELKEALKKLLDIKEEMEKFKQEYERLMKENEKPIIRK